MSELKPKEQEFILSGETRLSQLLEAIPAALDYIVSLNPHDFARLRNPFARKYMSPRISLSRLAVMLGLPEKDFLQKLAQLSDNDTEIKLDETKTASKPPVNPANKPEWLEKADATQIKWLDLLSVDDVLGDPFPPVSIAVKNLAPGAILAMRHRWQPQPLYDIWAKMRLQWYSQQVSEDEWYVFVHRPKNALPVLPAPTVTVELRHLASVEIVPRLLTLFEQLQPQQQLEILSVTGQIEQEVRAAFEKNYSGQYSWSQVTSGTGKALLYIGPNLQKPL